MHHSAASDHAQHDLMLIAGHAAGDLSTVEAATAEALLTACTGCAEVHRDLLGISAAARALPRQARAPRDFRITAEQAERLRERSWLGTLLRPFASARSATRPLAAALTSLGVAGLLVATIVPGLLGGAASAPTRESVAGGPGSTHDAVIGPEFAAPTAAPAAAPGAAAASAAPVDVTKAQDSGMNVVAVGGEHGSSAGVGGTLSGVEDSGERLRAAEPPNLVVLGSLALLLVGLALFGARFAARRLR